MPIGHDRTIRDEFERFHASSAPFPAEHMYATLTGTRASSVAVSRGRRVLLLVLLLPLTPLHRRFDSFFSHDRDAGFFSSIHHRGSSSLGIVGKSLVKSRRDDDHDDDDDVDKHRPYVPLAGTPIKIGSTG